MGDCLAALAPGFRANSRLDNESQPKSYQQEILPDAIRNRVSVEAASSFGWERWVGRNGQMIAVDEFGVSGKSEDVLARFGFTVEKILQSVLIYFKDKNAD